MIEVIATLLRWLQLASNMILVGSCVFLAIAGVHPLPLGGPPGAGAALARAHPAGGIAGHPRHHHGPGHRHRRENAWHPQAWLALVQNTHMGHIWVGRAACALSSAPSPSISALLPRRAGNTSCAPPSLPPPWPWARWRAMPPPKTCPSCPICPTPCTSSWPASGSAPCPPSWWSVSPASAAGRRRAVRATGAPASRRAPSSASTPCSNRAKKRSRPTPRP